MLISELSPQLKSYISTFVNRYNHIIFGTHGILFKLEIGPGGEFILSSKDHVIDTLLLDEEEVVEAILKYINEREKEHANQ